ncbi:MAG: pstS2, partial [Gammaproteobacteria bacterium]|nr:pstS2 [Gammaproteobacteria bacterium]
MIIKKLLQSLVLALGLSTAVCFAQQVIGAGASSIYPALSQWVQSYAAATSTQINYESTGSGNGLRQLDNHTVDFAATDMPLTAAELSQKNLLQFPVLTGGIVPVVNIAGIQNNQLILNGQVLADIYMGKVSKWNDPEITALNPGLSLPNALIIAVHRSDSSGTTYNFTNYLAAQSPAWSAQVGADTIVAWPGFGLGVKTNAGIATQVE